MKSETLKIQQYLEDMDKTLDDINLICFTAPRFPLKRKQIYDRLTKSVEKMRDLLEKFQETYK